MTASHVLWIVIMAAFGAKAAVIIDGFHPLLGLGAGALIGLASTWIYARRTK